MAALNNYLRGNNYRSRDSLKVLFPEVFTDEEAVGNEAFIILFNKTETGEGFITSDLVFLVASQRKVIILGGDKVIASIPVDRFNSFQFRSIETPNYYFPPSVPPQRAGLFQMRWDNNDGNSRLLIAMFPDRAILPIEFDFPAQKVHKKLAEWNKETPFFTDEASGELEMLLSDLPGWGVPNEVNDEDCFIDEFLGV